MGLSLDRPLDDFHHCPEDCLLVGTHLHNAKSTHAAFKTWEPLTQHCREMGMMNLPPIMQKCVLYSGLSSKG